MKIAKISSLLCFLLFFASYLNAQILQRDTIFSTVLNEKRPISIFFHKNFESDKIEKYSVLYLLDGNENLESVTALVNYLSNKRFSRLPNLVIVAIPNMDRTRDLTPALADSEDKRSSTYPNSGGLANFTAFMEKELVPHINNKIANSGFNILVGHSFGGLAATHMMINKPDLFNAFIIIDPSYWWDGATTLPKLNTYLNTDDASNKNIFLALANNVVYSTQELVHEEHFDAIQTVGKEYLPQSKLNKKQWKFKFYEDDEHGTIPVPALYDGLKFLFKEIDLPMKSIIKDPTILEDCYSNLAEQLHCEILPSRRTFIDLIVFAKSRGEVENAKKLREMGLKIYENDIQLLEILN